MPPSDNYPDGRGLADTLEQLVRMLRDDSAVVEHLSERQAVYSGYPDERKGYPVSVIVTPIHDGSTPGRGAVTRDTRVQVTVKSTRGWREAREPSPGALTTMYRILDAVGDRLDTADGLAEIPLGGQGGPAPQPMDDGYLAVTSDWRLRSFRLRFPNRESSSSDSGSDSS